MVTSTIVVALILATTTTIIGYAVLNNNISIPGFSTGGNKIFLDDVQKNSQLNSSSIGYDTELNSSAGNISQTVYGTMNLAKSNGKQRIETQTASSTLLTNRLYFLTDGNYSCDKSPSTPFSCIPVNKTKNQYLGGMGTSGQSCTLFVFQSGFSYTACVFIPEDLFTVLQDWQQRGIVKINYLGGGNFAGRNCDNLNIVFDIPKFTFELAQQGVNLQGITIDKAQETLCLDKESGFISQFTSDIDYNKIIGSQLTKTDYFFKLTLSNYNSTPDENILNTPPLFSIIQLSPQPSCSGGTSIKVWVRNGGFFTINSSSINLTGTNANGVPFNNSGSQCDSGVGYQLVSGQSIQCPTELTNVSLGLNRVNVIGPINNLTASVYCAGPPVVTGLSELKVSNIKMNTTQDLSFSLSREKSGNVAIQQINISYASSYYSYYHGTGTSSYNPPVSLTTAGSAVAFDIQGIGVPSYYWYKGDNYSANVTILYTDISTTTNITTAGTISGVIE